MMTPTIVRRKKRQALACQLRDLEELNCTSCPKKINNHNRKPENICGECPAFLQIRSIGKQLIGLAEKTKIETPEHLTMSTYEYLRENEWKKEEIREHYKIDSDDFAFFLNSNRKAIQPKTLVRKKGEINLTPEEYVEYKRQERSDEEIRRILGISLTLLNQWKKANDVSGRVMKYKKRVKKTN